jgi:Zn-dependent protease with chaperone function
MVINTRATRGSLLLIALCTSAVTLVAQQTAIKLPKNKYTPQQDVELGLKAAAEVRQQYPIIKDERISVYLTKLGDRLVAVAPQQLKQPVYQYSFTPVNLKEINAFALPGGPMFVQRGMFDAAASEGEVVGVMAHELSHVLLRHGTANATKAENPWLQIGQMAGAIGGAVVGGAAGSAIAQGSQVGLGSLLLRYSRDFEKQADLLGSQIMAKAGYDPRALAHMFETIAKEAKSSGGGGGPQWMSSHPDPGNRTAYISKEAQSLSIPQAADQNEFAPIKSAFAALPPAKSMGDLAKGKGGAGGGETLQSVGTPGQPVPPPSAQFQNLTGGKIFQASVPDNWTSLSTQTTIKVVPQNGYGELNGQTVFTHGIEFGVTKAASRDLQEATKAWLQSIAPMNPELRVAGTQSNATISQRAALATPLVNPSPLGGQERIVVYTTFVGEGTLFYYLTLAPEKDAQALQDTFKRVGESIRLAEPR